MFGPFGDVCDFHFDFHIFWAGSGRKEGMYNVSSTSCSPCYCGDIELALISTPWVFLSCVCVHEASARYRSQLCFHFYCVSETHLLFASLLLLLYLGFSSTFWCGFCLPPYDVFDIRKGKRKIPRVTNNIVYPHFSPRNKENKRHQPPCFDTPLLHYFIATTAASEVMKTTDMPPQSELHERCPNRLYNTLGHL